ncbi:MAG: hypothetical protein COU83_02390, partial [Candidatus Portnoybacteria bacterium CG10_big_fil_rev_8_21_14_0_10_40_22]
KRICHQTERSSERANAREKLEIVKDRVEAAQILGDWPSPPKAAKLVRTNLRILHMIFYSVKNHPKLQATHTNHNKNRILMFLTTE